MPPLGLLALSWTGFFCRHLFRFGHFSYRHHFAGRSMPAIFHFECHAMLTAFDAGLAFARLVSFTRQLFYLCRARDYARATAFAS